MQKKFELIEKISDKYSDLTRGALKSTQVEAIKDLINMALIEYDAEMRIDLFKELIKDREEMIESNK